MGTRNPKQVRTHAQKYEMRLAREQLRRGVPVSEPVESCKAGGDQFSEGFPSGSPCLSHERMDEAECEVPRSPKPSGLVPPSVSPITIQAAGCAKTSPFEEAFGEDDEDLLVVPTLNSEISVRSDHLSDIDLDDIPDTDGADWLEVNVDVSA